MTTSGAASRHRVFFALWPDEETAEHLHALGHNLVSPISAPNGRPHRGRGRLIPERNIHLTLAFVGSVSDDHLRDLEDAADRSNFAACDVHLDRLGFWPRGGVVYAGASGGAATTTLLGLMRDVGTLIADAGLPHDHRPAVPHVTLARNVRGIDLPRLGTAFFWQASRFALVRSELHPSGARYATIAEWPLSDDAEVSCPVA